MLSFDSRSPTKIRWPGGTSLDILRLAFFGRTYLSGLRAAIITIKGLSTRGEVRSAASGDQFPATSHQVHRSANHVAACCCSIDFFRLLPRPCCLLPRCPPRQPRGKGAGKAPGTARATPMGGEDTKVEGDRRCHWWPRRRAAQLQCRTSYALLALETAA